jgi:hypothetical protein
MNKPKRYTLRPVPAIVKAGTHAGATIKAVRIIGKPATAHEIKTVVKSHRLLRATRMRVADAVQFQLFDLTKRKGVLKIAA